MRTNFFRSCAVLMPIVACWGMSVYGQTWSGMTITENQEYSWTEDPYVARYDGATIATGVTVHYTDAYTIGNANFDWMIMRENASLLFDENGQITGNTAVFTNLNTATGSIIRFSTISFNNVSFQGSTINGTLTFDNGIIETSGNFTNMTFGASSVLNVRARWNNSADFSNSQFYGKVNFSPGDYEGIKFNGVTFYEDSEMVLLLENEAGSNFQRADFTGAKFLGTFTSRGGDLTGAKFDGAEFRGTTTLWVLPSSSFVGTQFYGTTTMTTNVSSAIFNQAKFKNGSKTTFSGELIGTSFANVNFESGSEVYIKPNEVTDTIFDTVNIQENALLYIDAYGSGFKFINSTVESGGILKITSDGWQRDLTGATFDGSVFSGNVFFGVTDQAEWNFLTLAGASFKGVTFSGIAGNATDFYLVNMQGASFQGAQMTGTVNFTGMRNDGGSMRAGYMDNVDFNHANLSGNVTFTQTKLSSAIFSDATLSGTVNFAQSDLNGATFENAQLTGTVNFTASRNASNQIIGGDLSSINFRGTLFNGGVTFEDVNLYNADFSGATLDGSIDFIHADLVEAVLEEAELIGAISFTGEKNASHEMLSGFMTRANFKGAYIGGNVTFNNIDLSNAAFEKSTSGKSTIIDGATFTSTGLYAAIFSDAVIRGNTSFNDYSWLDSAKFDGASFESTNGSRVEFRDSYMANTTFNGTNFNGSVLFYDSGWNNGYYNNADFSGANFNVGSNVIFEGNGATIGSIKTGSTPLYAGTLTFSNVDINGIDFANAIFQATSEISFSNANVSNANFSGLTVKAGANNSGGQLSFSNGATVDNVTFEGTTFEQNTEFSFYDTKFVSSNALNFKNTSFGGITRFSDGYKSTDLSGTDFTGAAFKWDSGKGTMFFMQNTGLTYDQLKSTKNYNTGTGTFDFRGMDISENTNISGNDFRGSQINAANFAGLWGNDFRDSIYSAENEPISYGTSFIAANGNLGGLNNHTSATHNEFVIREKLAGSTTFINLLESSNRLNSGVTLKIGGHNEIFAYGPDRGLDVHGTIQMDSSSVFHMRDGAILNFEEGSVLQITVGANENYILIADFDHLSLDLEMLQFFVHVADDEAFALMDYEWKLEVMNYYEDNPYNQLILYYVIPEPSTYAGILGIVVLGLATRRLTRRNPLKGEISSL